MNEPCLASIAIARHLEAEERAERAAALARNQEDASLDRELRSAGVDVLCILSNEGDDEQTYRDFDDVLRVATSGADATHIGLELLTAINRAKDRVVERRLTGDRLRKAEAELDAERAEAEAEARWDAICDERAA